MLKAFGTGDSDDKMEPAGKMKVPSTELGCWVYSGYNTVLLVRFLDKYLTGAALVRAGCEN